MLGTSFRKYEIRLGRRRELVVFKIDAYPVCEANDFMQVSVHLLLFAKLFKTPCNIQHIEIQFLDKHVE